MKRVAIVVLAIGLAAGVPASALAELSICRSAGFWSTHAGEEKKASQNIAQAVLNAGGPLQICGTEISNTSVGSWDSALEAMCVSPEGTPALQLVRQLTATGLNCVLSDAGADCASARVAGLFQLCNAACLDALDAQLIDDCIFRLACVNEGGTVVVDAAGWPVCAVGYCDDLSPCSAEQPCTVGECLPAEGCDDRDLCPDLSDDGELNGSGFCFEPIGPAGSSRACHEARKNGELNRPPVADAGPDQAAVVGQLVQLDGSGSFDPDGNPLSYDWSLVSTPAGSAATLDDPSLVGPTFVLDLPGSYEVQLVVDDGELFSTPDSVTITTENTSPVADAGPDQTVFAGDTVHLDGSDSYDLEGDPLSFDWSFTSVPTGSTAALNDPAAVQPTFVVDLPGSYVAQLVVNDGLDQSAPDAVTITTENSPPVADAGPDQTVSVGETVQLDGSGSSDVDGDPLSFDWSLVAVPAGSAAMLDDPTAVLPTFVADLAGVYVAQLIVHDGTVGSAPDSVTILTANTLPVADAGADQTVFVGDTVQLDGSGSSDVDGDVLTFAWALTVQPAGSTALLDDLSAVTPTFVVDLPGTYVVQLIVNDGLADSAPDTVTVLTDNSPPVADAGPDQTVFVGDTVQLDGSGSSDVDGDPLSFAWALISVPPGSNAMLDDPAAVRPDFEVDLPGTYVAQLIVNDTTVDSAPDTTSITTENSPPVAEAGPDQSVFVSDTVQLDGSGSFDADGDPLSFAWSLVTVPAGSAAVLDDSTAVAPSFLVDQPGSYVAQLIVNDGSVDSAPDAVTVTTENSPPVADAGPDQTVSAGDTVQLDGSGSWDADGDFLTFVWALTVRPAGSVAALDDPAAIQPTFVADEPGAYVAQLIVNDGSVDSSPDTVVVETVAGTLTLSPDPLVLLTFETGTLTVGLDAPADAGGVEVDLTSSDVAIASVPSSVTVEEGESSTDVDVTVGDRAGSVTVTASANGMTDATSTIDVSAREMTLSLLNVSLVGVGRTAELAVNLTQPAPAGGVTVAVASDDIAILTVTPPGVVAISGGGTGGLVELAGVSSGLTNVRGSAPGYQEASLIVEVTENLISVPTTLTVALTEQESVPITIQPDPAPPGGLEITLTSDDPAVEVLTPTVMIPEGAVVASGQVRGASPGTATVKASSLGFSGDTSLVTTTAEFNILEDPVRFPKGFPATVTVQLEAGGVPVAASAGGVPFSLTPLDPTCVAAETGAIPEGLVNTTVSLNYGGSATLPCTTTVTVADTNITPDTVTVTVDPQPTSTLYSPLNALDGYDMGAGLQEGNFRVILSAAQHGGVTVHVESSNSAVLRVSPDSTTPGTASVDIALADGQTQASFYVQGVEGARGSPVLTATTPGFVDDTLVVDVVESGLEIASGILGCTLAASIDTLDPDDPFCYRTGAPHSTGAYLNRRQAPRAGGGGLTVTVTHTNPSVAELVTSAATGQTVTVALAEGASTTPSSVAAGGVAFSPLATGVTEVSASIPGFLTTDAARTTVTVTAPTSTLYSPLNALDGYDMGAGLQEGNFRVILSAAQHGGVTVHVESSNSAVLRVSPDSTTPGTASVDIALADGQTQASFYVQGVEGARGSPVLTATTPGFVDDTLVVDVVEPGLEIASGILGCTLAASIDTLDPDDPFCYRTGAPHSTGAYLNRRQAPRAGGGGLTVTVTHTNPSVAELVTSAATGQTVTVALAEGASTTPSSVAAGGVAFSPLATGVTEVSASIPGFLTTDAARTTVTVTAPTSTLYSPLNALDGYDMGAGLQEGSFRVILSAAQHGGVTVHVESSNSAVLRVSPDSTTPGTASVDIALADGQTQASFYVQGVEGARGSPVLTATTPGFVDDTLVVDVVEPGLEIASGILGCTLAASIDTLDPDDPFCYRTGAPHSTGAYLNRRQAPRAGGGGLTVTVTHTNPSVAELVTSAATGQTVTVALAEGASTTPSSVAAGGVAFSPLATGVTEVSASIPGFLTTDAARTTVTVTAPTSTLYSPLNALDGYDMGAGLQEGSFRVILSAAQHGGVTVHVESSNSAVLRVSPDSTTPGTASVDIALADGQTQASFYVQGVEGARGSPVLTATTPGFVDDTLVVDVVEPGLEIASGILGCTLAASIDTLDPDDPFCYRTGAPHSTGAYLNRRQAPRAGGGGLTVTVTHTNPSVAELVTSAATGQTVTVALAEGASTTPSSVAAGGVAFSPLATGVTEVSASIPGFLTTDAARTTVTVTGP